MKILKFTGQDQTLPLQEAISHNKLHLEAQYIWKKSFIYK